MRNHSRSFERARILAFAFWVLGVGALGQAETSAADDCRSPWGAEDQRGAANRLTPAKTLQAAVLIKQGRTYQLGRPYERAMPVYGARSFSMAVSHQRGPLGKNKLTWNEEFVAGQIGQVGTQFDGLPHIGIDGRYFNCNDARDIVRAEGMVRLGVENVGSIFTRGVLVDVAAYKGVAQLEKGYEITVADLEGALARQGVSVREGDVVIIHTGWGSLWIADNAKYTSGAPGIGMGVGQWLVDHKVVMVGGDTSGVEVAPNPQDPTMEAEVHQLLITRNGIYILENLDTSELARDQGYEFAFVFAPLRLKGGTGSPGNPIAVR